MPENPYQKIYKFGDKDLEPNGNIAQAQTKLKLLGYYFCDKCRERSNQNPNCPDCAINGIFNRFLEEAVAQFQMERAVDSFGHPLVIDGEIGPITWSSMFPEASKASLNIASPSSIASSNTEYELRSRIVINSLHQIGVTEVGGDNRGPMIKKYLNTVDLGEGNPWCMAFVEYVVALSCQDLGIRLKWITKKRDFQLPLYKTGHVWTFYNWAKENKMIVPAVEAVPGDIWVQLFKESKGHTGFVNATKDGYITTVEGNTNRGGSRQGDQVMSLSRKYSSVNAIIRLRIEDV